FTGGKINKSYRYGEIAACCPLVEGLYLQEADSMLQLLCSPSQHRTDILAWICSRYEKLSLSSLRAKEPDVLTKDMAVLGQELMLCKASDLDLIRGDASPWRQLRFLEQLLTLVPGCMKSAGQRADGAVLLKELFAPENLPYLQQMLNPEFDPWPTHIKCVCCLCVFLNSEAQSPPAFSPSSLRVAACDLQQLMATFSHVYETDLRAYCTREPPSFSLETNVFQRVHQLLLACNTVQRSQLCSTVK
uniref:HAUS augmin-like complex, subunit 7 n=1 Tax=Amphilophus citrinellus TaxID=61819 RepID=A0A3Q0RCD2_AMPCI